MNATNQLKSIQEKGYSIDFEKTIQATFENYKKIALFGGLATFFFCCVAGLGSFLFLASIFGFANITQETILGSLAANEKGFESITSSIGLVLVNALLNPFMCGFLKLAWFAKHDQPKTSSLFFDYYKAPYFKEIFMSTLVVSFLEIGISLLCKSLGIAFLGYVLSLLISLFTFFTFPLIVFGNLNGIQAVQESIRIVSKNPFPIFGLLVISYIAFLLGFIGCCIGMFFTFPILYSLHFVLYDVIIGTDFKTELDEIGHSEEE